MKTLITGSTGFAGHRLTEKLLEQGRDLRLLVRDASRLNLGKQAKNVEILEGDIADQALIDRAMPGVDTVYHIAACYRTAGVSDSVYHDVHVKATQYLLEAAERNQVERFVHCSTVGIHGDITDPPANETYRTSPGDIYQETKLEGEELALGFFRKTGLPVSVIRPTAIYGPGDLRLLKLFKIASKPVVVLLGDGRIDYHMGHVDDLADSFILAAQKDKAIGEAFIIGSDDVFDLNTLISTLKTILNNNAPTIHLPALPFQLLGSVTEKICVPLNINPPIYRRRVDFFTKSRSFDISKAKSVLGYSPRFGMKEGLTQTAKWYQDNNLI